MIVKLTDASLQSSSHIRKDVKKSKKTSPKRNKYKDALPYALSTVLAHAYYSGQLATEDNEIELSEIMARFIFDNMDWIRRHPVGTPIADIPLPVSEDLTSWSSYPYPENLGELEYYCEKYLMTEEQ